MIRDCSNTDFKKKIKNGILDRNKSYGAESEKRKCAVNLGNALLEKVVMPRLVAPKQVPMQMFMDDHSHQSQTGAGPQSGNHCSRWFSKGMDNFMTMRLINGGCTNLHVQGDKVAKYWCRGGTGDGTTVYVCVGWVGVSVGVWQF